MEQMHKQRSCARPALAWDTASLSMTNRVIQRQCNFIVHLKNLKKSDLAKQIYDEQLSNGYPGLITEAQRLCDSVGLPSITKNREKEDNKIQWKQRIMEAVERKNEIQLKRKIQSFQKLEVMKEEKYEQKEYLSNLTLEEARMFFRVRTKMVKCKLNQSSDRGNRASLWKCNRCGHVDSQSHILYCPNYQDLRVGKDF